LIVIKTLAIPCTTQPLHIKGQMKTAIIAKVREKIASDYT